jgi:hypothetical protein
MELVYCCCRTAVSDFQLVLISLRAFIASHGNIKPHGKPDPDLECRELLPSDISASAWCACSRTFAVSTALLARATT